MIFYPLLHKPHPTQLPQNSSLMIPYQLITILDQLLLTMGYPDSGATCHHTLTFSYLLDVEACHIPVSLQMEPPRSQLSKEPLIATSPLMKDKDLSLD
jgi:hypothetical protein